MITLRTVPTEASSDAIGLLLECHERIRRFSRLAVRIATDPAPEKDVKDAAFAVHRYFHKALPLHIQDEDLSLRPMLTAAGTAQVAQALDRMHGEHGPIDAQVEALMPMWRRLMEDPAALDELRPAMTPLAQALEEAMLAHLAHEEEVIFPAARQFLDADRLNDLAGQMRDRRRP